MEKPHGLTVDTIPAPKEYPKGSKTANAFIQLVSKICISVMA
jgi:hypothetical protein